MPNGNDGDLTALAREIDPTSGPTGPEPAKPSGKPGETPTGGTGATGPAGPTGASAAGGESGATGTTGGTGGGGTAPPQTVEDLLKDPKLAPLIQRWADKSAAAQVRTAVGQVQAEDQQAQQQANMEAWSNYFAQFSKEELAEVLAESPEAAQAYGAVQQYTAGQHQGASQQEVATAAQVYSYGHQISVYNGLLEASDLPQDQKDALKPENYTHLGAAGINTWGQAVQAALIKHEAQKAAKTEIDTRWEATKQERLAELEKEHPGAAGSAGAPGAPGLPLIETPDEVLLESALGKKPGGKT